MPILNEFRPCGVDAFVANALDRVRPRKLDDTVAPVAALLASCQDAASQVLEQRGVRQRAELTIGFHIRRHLWGVERRRAASLQILYFAAAWHDATICCA